MHRTPKSTRSASINATNKCHFHYSFRKHRWIERSRRRTWAERRIWSVHSTCDTHEVLHLRAVTIRWYNRDADNVNVCEQNSMHVFKTRRWLMKTNVCGAKIIILWMTSFFLISPITSKSLLWDFSESDKLATKSKYSAIFQRDSAN